jgi:uncharacterized protein YndB with AHSA1/START domain
MTTNDRELVLTRLIDVPRAKLWRCWTEPELVKQWFTPPPFTVPHAEMDVRVGGKSRITMRGPDGKDMMIPGTYLEVVKNEKLVFTDAYTGDWEPGEKPFMTAIVTFADENGQTRYTAVARHWSVEDRETHEKMGFHTGWGIAADQMTALAKKL